ncbi:unnamed protein product [Bemisia tabaci]|uniref:Myb-like domain-containing protein n=1 Tax=Bemisia tabaci TaxID=7038 RepID=A0A9P0AFI4_BEMTA|nr:unnamed protein product [Bemisia tabaci]
MVSPSMTDTNEKKPRARPRPRKPNISSARRKQDNGRNVEVAMRTFEENIRGKSSNTGEKNPIIGEILYTFQDSTAPVSEDAKDTLNVLKEFVNVCKVSVTARLVTEDDYIPGNNTVPKKRAQRKLPPTVQTPKATSAATEPPGTVESKPKGSESSCSPVVASVAVAKSIDVKTPESQSTQKKGSEIDRISHEPADSQLQVSEPPPSNPTQSQESKLITPKPDPPQSKDSKLVTHKPDHSEGSDLTTQCKRKSNELKVFKKASPVKVSRTTNKIESSQDKSEMKYNSVTPSVTKQICEEIIPGGADISLGDKGSEKSPEGIEVLDPGDFDFLRAPPKKKRISYYSQRKREYGTKYALQSGDTINKKEMTMHDLIFYNPKTNPMSNSQVPVKKNSSQTNIKQETNDLVASRLEEEAIDDVDEADSEMPVPQLKLSADGKIILDPKSLVVQTSAEKSLKALENSSVIEEDGTIINRFSKAKKKYHFWTPLETLRFYRALNTIGTDFSLMQSIFPERTRHDLKRKFKKEERTNRELLDKALSASAEFDVDMLEQDIKRDTERAEMQRKAKEEEARKKKEEKEAKKLEKLEKKSNPKTKTYKSKRIRNLLPSDTGKYARRSKPILASVREKKPRKAKIPKKSWLKEEPSDTSEEEVPDFDNLYPSDDDLISHIDHTYSSNHRKRLKIDDSDEEYECKPRFKDRSRTKLGENEAESSSTLSISCQNESIDKNSVIEESPSPLGSSKNESAAVSIENQTAGETTSSVQVVSEDNLVYKFVSGPNRSEIESTSKSAPLYGNKLIGINHESESETDTRNEEKENENSNVNDTVIVNEYIIISDLSGNPTKSTS